MVELLSHGVRAQETITEDDTAQTKKKTIKNHRCAV